MTTCRICTEPFIPFRPLQSVCSVKCARKVPIVAKNTLKRERKETKAKLAALKPVSYWEKKAEEEVNRYVRLRDAGRGCISCDKPANWSGVWHASHLRSVGAASAVRYCLWNIHKACNQCNFFQSGNVAAYEPRLRTLIGDAKVDWLRTQNQITRYSIDYLQRLKRVFAKKARRMEKRLELQN